MADIYNKSGKNERLHAVLLYWSSSNLRQDEVVNYNASEGNQQGDSDGSDT
jgi:hypothetical protein